MLKWKDETSYSRSDTDRTPRVWAAVGEPLRLKVHRIHGIPGVWFASCDFFERKQLDATEVDEAKNEAAALVVARLHQAMGFYASASPPVSPLDKGKADSETRNEGAK